MRLSDLDLMQCTQCGRLFQVEPGRTYCRRCESLDEMEIGADGLPVDLEPSLRGKAQRILDIFREETQLEHLCVRCRQRPPIEESEFCLTCHIDLNDALGAATHDLFHRMELHETDPAGPPSVLSMLDEKRDRTRTARLNPVAARHFRRG